MNEDVIVGPLPVVLYVVAVEFRQHFGRHDGRDIYETPEYRSVGYMIQFTGRPGHARKHDDVATRYGEILIRARWADCHFGLAPHRAFVAVTANVNATTLRAAPAAGGAE